MGGFSEAPDETAEPVARRPEHHRMATPSNSMGSGVSFSPRHSHRLLRRPENHPMETPRTSIGSAHRLSLASLREARNKCTRRQKTAFALTCLIFLLVLVGGVVALVLLGKSKGIPNHQPQGACSTVQIQQGCAPGFCEDDQCTCAPNYDQVSSSNCAVPLANKLMQFFVYEVLGDAANSLGCTGDFAQAYSLQGILWHIHNAVVNQSCPRSMNLTRIVRCRATVFNTEKPFLEWKGQFGPYTTYDSDGGCTSPDCQGIWNRYGHVVGCLPWSDYMGGYSYGNTSHLYSFPERAKNAACLNEQGVFAFFTQCRGGLA